VQLAAINRGVPSNAQLRVPLQRVTIGQVVQLGANVANPMALTWYDADYLIVLNAGSRLWQVPVDGQQATGPRLAPPGTISITADGAANALVAELSGRNLEVSASLDGPWQPLALHGQSPAYPG
jgi:hypothetical protein